MIAMSKPSQEILPSLADQLLRVLQQKKLSVVTAESCTAGLLSLTLSDAEGAAVCLHGGFVTYTKCHKACALGVSPELLRSKGAVCPDVARAMAQGALNRSEADFGAAITGVAGPEPDDDGNPVGRVCIAIAQRDGPGRDIEKHYGAIGRDAVRHAAVADTLHALIEHARSHDEER
jgi:nicotinamide-nucleotide amidase